MGYTRLENPRDEEVNQMLRNGWTLHSVTAIGNGTVWYHFVRE